MKRVKKISKSKFRQENNGQTLVRETYGVEELKKGYENICLNKCIKREDNTKKKTFH